MAKGQTQTLYSLAAVLGLVESGNKEDPFHMIVYRISGKTSVRELTPPEAAAVEAELRRQLREQRPKKKAASPEYPGKMTAGQKAYAWRLLYDLAKLQHAPLSADAMTKFVARSNDIMMLLTK